MEKNEVREGLFGQKLVYKRTDTEGEGFGNRKVGMRCKVKFYEHEERGEGEFKWKQLVNVTTREGTIVQITRRINYAGPYYDYSYKVRLDDGTHVWRSHVVVE